MEYNNGEASGAVFAGTAEMEWLYAAVADLWAIPAAIGCTRGGEVNANCCTISRRATPTPQ